MKAVFAALLAFGLAACSQPAGVRDSVVLADDPAPKLSDYGFFATPNAGAAPAEGVVPYDLINALFSDYAGKHRFVYVPKGRHATYNPDTVFDFPVGAVLIKTFAFAPDMRDPALNERWIETRLLIRKADGWVAYPYIWNKDQTEAVYSPVGGGDKIETISPEGKPLSIDYAVPNKNQCKGCHVLSGAISPIGPKARNLNRPVPAGGENQLAEWTRLGILAGAPDASAAPAVPDWRDESQPLDARARAWLDINCAHCHRAEGPASNSGLFLTWGEQDPTALGVHKRPVAAGRGAGDLEFDIAPGDPAHSILMRRVESAEPGIMMPELGRSLTDPAAVALLARWIESIR